jgi:hypothetical protein
MAKKPLLVMMAEKSKVLVVSLITTNKELGMEEFTFFVIA